MEPARRSEEAVPDTEIVEGAFVPFVRGHGGLLVRLVDPIEIV